MLEKIIPTIVSVFLTFFLGLISKQLSDIKASRLMHQAAFEQSTQQMNDMKDEISSLKTIVEESQMRASRYRIIRFDDEEMSNTRHSDDHWEQILEDVDIYENYAHSHPDFINNKGTAAMQRIKTANMNGRGRKNIYV